MAIYETEATTAPVYSGPYLIEYPFAERGDNTAIVASLENFVRSESYAPPTLSATLTITIATVSTTLYCVGDYNVSRTDAGLTTFTRKWATVPATRIESGGTATATIPYIEIFSTGTGSTTRLFRAVGTVILNEFYRVGTGQTYTDETKIPVRVPNSTVVINATTGEIKTTPTTGPGAAGDYPYLLEPSALDRWMGNIWIRRSRYFKSA